MKLFPIIKTSSRRKPLKSLAQEKRIFWGPLFFIFLSILFICLEKSLSFQSFLTDLTVPFFQGAQIVVSPFKKTFYFFQDRTELIEEINQLRQQRDYLLKWEHLSHYYRRENDALRKLANALSSLPEKMATVSFIGKLEHPYGGHFLIAAGSSENIHKNQVVLGKHGLLGRVIKVEQHSSYVLPLTDIKSRVPVQVEGKSISAIVAGKNQNTLSLLYIKGKEDLEIGDRLLTTGEGGIFPRNICVGVIHSFTEGKIEAVPFENLEEVGDFVFVWGYKEMDASPRKEAS